MPAPSTEWTRWLWDRKLQIKTGEKGNMQFMCGGSRPFLVPDDDFKDCVEKYFRSVKAKQRNYPVDTLQGHVAKVHCDIDDRVIMRAFRNPVTQKVMPFAPDYTTTVLKAKTVAKLFHEQVLQKYYPQPAEGVDLQMYVQGAEPEFKEQLDANKKRIPVVLLPAAQDSDLDVTRVLPPLQQDLTTDELPPHLKINGCPHALPRGIEMEAPSLEASISSVFSTDLSFESSQSQRSVMDDDDDDEAKKADEDKQLEKSGIGFPNTRCCAECKLEQGGLDDQGPQLGPSHDLIVSEKMAFSSASGTGVTAGVNQLAESDAGPQPPAGWFWAIFKVGWHYTCPNIPIISPMMLQLRESFIVEWRKHGGVRPTFLNSYEDVVDRSVAIKFGLRWPGAHKSQTCSCVGKGKIIASNGKKGPMEDCGKCYGKGFIPLGRPYWPFFRFDTDGRIVDIHHEEVDAAMVERCILRLSPEPAAATPFVIPFGAPKAVFATDYELSEKKQNGKPHRIVFAQDAIGMKSWPKVSYHPDSIEWQNIRKMIQTKSWPEYKELEPQIVVSDVKQKFFCIKVTGEYSSHCQNKGSSHGSSTVWFLANRASHTLVQRCFCEKGTPRKKGPCTEFRSDPRPIPQKFFENIFTKAEYSLDLWALSTEVREVAPSDFGRSQPMVDDAPAPANADGTLPVNNATKKQRVGLKTAKKVVVRTEEDDQDAASILALDKAAKGFDDRAGSQSLSAGGGASRSNNYTGVTRDFQRTTKKFGPNHGKRQAGGEAVAAGPYVGAAMVFEPHRPVKGNKRGRDKAAGPRRSKGHALGK